MAKIDTATTQSLSTDPTFQAYLQKVQQLVGQLNSPTAQNKADILQQLNILQGQANDYAHAHGLASDYVWNFNTNQAQQQDFASRHPYLTAGLLGAGAVAAPVAFGTIGVGAGTAGTAAGTDAAATGGATAGTAGTTAAGTAGTAADVSTVGPTAASGGTTASTIPASLSSTGLATDGGATAAGAAGAAGSSSIWKQILLGGAIPAAATIGGAAIAANASTRAAEIQAAETDKQLAQAKAIYEQERADEAPYRQSGYGSLNALNYGLGLPAVSLPSATMTSPTTTPPTHTTQGGQVLPDRTQPAGTPSIGTAVPRDTYAANTLNAVGGTSRVLNPANGQIYQIPQSDVAAALQAGGQVVS